MSIFQGEVFAARRTAFLDAIAAREPASVALFPAAPVFTRNNDVEHEYRQDSDVFYLTGFDEPESVVVLDAVDRQMTMFVRPRDPAREIWDGPRAGVDGASALFGASKAHVMERLADELPKLLENKNRLYYRLGQNSAMDQVVLRAIDRTRARAKLGVRWPVEIVDPGTVVHEMRLFKGTHDLAMMERAAAITTEAHVRAMAEAKPDMFEYEVEARILEVFRRGGCERPAYGSIVGSGPNATILHYRKNDRRIGRGDLLLIDAGCEYGYYASDVTRTFPVGAPFSKQQQAIYEIVLEAQEAGIAKTKPGETIDGIHGECVAVIVRGLVRLGLLQGEVAENIAKETYKRFYMHKTSHWLGMDVHDVGAYWKDGVQRKLEPGMVLTIEPGIYIGRDDDTVAPEWRGIGVRIEDDILVTPAGPSNLTRDIPKTVADVHRACGHAG